MAGEPHVFVDDVKLGAQQVQQPGRLLGNDVDILADLEAGILDARDQSEGAGTRAADEGVGANDTSSISGNRKGCGSIVTCSLGG